MNDETAPKDELAFDHAEFSSPEDAAPACSLCKRMLGSNYFTMNGAIACEDCHHLISSQVKESKSARAFLRAGAFGVAAALGGSIAWYAVAKITGMEIGLLAIAVGYAVGKAVRHGARGPGARRYQALAMLLTYLSITGSYVPLVWKGVTEVQAETPAKGAGAPRTAAVPGGAAAADPEPSSATSNDGQSATPAAEPVAPAAVGFVRMVLTCIVVLALSLVAPFLGGASNIIGILLIGIALYEAWKFNRKVPIVLDGPLRTNAMHRPMTAPPAGA